MVKKKLINVIDEMLWRRMKVISYLRGLKLEEIIEESFREFLTKHSGEYKDLMEED